MEEKQDGGRNERRRTVTIRKQGAKGKGEQLVWKRIGESGKDEDDRVWIQTFAPRKYSSV